MWFVRASLWTEAIHSYAELLEDGIKRPRIYHGLKNQVGIIDVTLFTEGFGNKHDADATHPG